MLFECDNECFSILNAFYFYCNKIVNQTNLLILFFKIKENILVACNYSSCKTTAKIF